MAKESRKRNRKKSKWMPPQVSKAYFSAASDIEFKEKHPVGYWFLVSLGIFALMLPVLIYLIFVSPLVNNSPWVMLGWRFVDCYQFKTNGDNVIYTLR